MYTRVYLCLCSCVPYISDFDEADEYCPRCDNHFYVEAESREKPQIVVATSDDPTALRESMQQLAAINHQ